MKNILIDLNILLDYYEYERRIKYPDSVKAFDFLKNKDFAFISSSSIDNFEFIKYGDVSKEYPSLEKKQKLEIVHNFIKEFLSFFKIAKTPSYIEIDYEDIEDSQIIASAKAIDALVLTRDQKMLQKHPETTIHPSNFKLPTPNFQLPTSNSQIDFANLKKQYFMYQPEIEKEMDKVLNSAQYIMGDAVKELEENLQNFTGAKYAVTCSSGTDALLLAMMAIEFQPGDEVITTPFTFIATAETIALLGAKPVFVDIDEKTYNIDPTKIAEKITDKTKAIIPVSLYGQPSDLDAIREIIAQSEVESSKSEDDANETSNFQLPTSNSNKIYLIVDGAQSFGATYKGKAEVHYCDIYTTSFFPAKPLGCYGEGGAVLTNNQKLATKIQSLRVHGQNKRYHHKYIGLGARLDTLQAAILNVKLKHYKKDLELRQKVAQKYSEVLSKKLQVINFQLPTSNFKLPTSNLTLPTIKPDRTSAWAQYSIRINTSNFQLQTSNSAIRSKLQTKLKEAGIPTAVHYPMPLHLQKCFQYLGYKEGDFPIAEKVSKEIISLPMNPYVTDKEIAYITGEIVK